MIRTSGTNRRAGFTLIELLVVIGMIALIVGSITTSMSAAQTRARIQKATADVNAIAQAILSYENHMAGDLSKVKEMSDAEATSANLSFLLGSGSSENTGRQLPALLMASLQGGAMRDPWGHPYRLRIHKVSGSRSGGFSNLKTSYYLPNMYRLGEGERYIEEQN